MESEKFLLKKLSNKAHSLVGNDEVSGSIWGMLINDVCEKYEEELSDDLQSALCWYFMNDVHPNLSEKEKELFSEDWFHENYWKNFGRYVSAELDWDVKQSYNNPNH